MVAEVKRVRIEIDSSRAGAQMRKLNRNMNQTRKSAQAIERTFRRLNSVLALGLGGTAITRGISNLISLSDAMSELRGRVALVASDTVGTDQAMQDLAATATLTFASFEATASAYARLGIVTKEVGVTHNQLISVIQALNDSLRISGASTKEAQATMTQFAQALGSGTLQGDEFRSFAESSPRGLKLLADALGVATGALKEMSKQGLLTRDVLIDAFITQAPRLRKEAESLPITVGRAWENVRTAFSVLLMDFERGTGIFGELAEALSTIAKSFNEWNNERESARLEEEERNYARIQARWMETNKLIKEQKRLLQEAQEVRMLTGQDRINELEQQLYLWEQRAADLREQSLDQFGRTAEGRQPGPMQLPGTGGTTTPSGPTKEQIREQERLNKIMQERAVIMDSAIWGAWLKNQKEVEESIKLSTSGMEEYVKANQDLRDSWIESIDPNAKYLKQLQELEKLMVAFPGHAEVWLEGMIKIHDQMDKDLDPAVKKTKTTIDELTVALGQTMANAVDSLGDTMVDFAFGVESSFSDMATSILKDIASMMVKFALMKIMFGGQTPGAAGNQGGLLSFLFNAKGNAFSGGNVVPFARGGVVSKPTVFPMANGAGIMGERGPEAVMPLTRDSKGRLGVSGGGTVVNIQNNTGQEVQQQVSNGPDGSEIVDIVIGQVDARIMSGGSTARAMETAYGVKRAGYHR